MTTFQKFISACIGIAVIVVLVCVALICGFSHKQPNDNLHQTYIEAPSDKVFSAQGINPKLDYTGDTKTTIKIYDPQVEMVNYHEDSQARIAEAQAKQGIFQTLMGWCVFCSQKSTTTVNTNPGCGCERTASHGNGHKPAPAKQQTAPVVLTKAVAPTNANVNTNTNTVTVNTAPAPAIVSCDTRPDDPGCNQQHPASYQPSGYDGVGVRDDQYICVDPRYCGTYGTVLSVEFMTQRYPNFHDVRRVSFHQPEPRPAPRPQPRPIQGGGGGNGGASKTSGVAGCGTGGGCGGNSGGGRGEAIQGSSATRNATVGSTFAGSRMSGGGNTGGHHR